MADKSMPVAKVDNDNNLVFGWAYTSITKDGEQVIDHSGEFVKPEELEKAAYLFNLAFRETGTMHQGESIGKLVESIVVTKEKLESMGLPSDNAPVGWWVGFYIEDDEVFNKIKSGEYNMFSIEGQAIREEVS